MYKKILVALENSRADASLLPHVEQLARLAHSHLLLVHVADGWVARNYNKLQLAESEEMKIDRAYLEKTAEHLRDLGLQVSIHLALGDPPQEILKVAAAHHCDLIAMTSHGHRLIAYLILGTTIHKVRHETTIPILLIRETKK